MKNIIFVGFSFFYCLVLTKCARILAVYPTPSISHQIVFRSLTEGLLKRGHEVTAITTDPAYPVGKAPKNLTEIDVHDISYKLWKKEFGKESVGNKIDIYKQISVIFRVMSKVFEEQIKIREVDDILQKRTKKYDLLLLEAYVKPILIFLHVLKIPVIQISSFGGVKHNYEVFGAPTHPLLYPAHIQQRLYNLSNWEKLQQLYIHWWFDKDMHKIEEEYNEQLKTLFGPDVPSIAELSNNVDMLFINSNPIWLDNQPMPQSIVYIGGIHIAVSKQIPDDVKLFLDSSKNGVIYFSLGTNVSPSSLPANKIQMFLKVFSRLPFDVLWKWDLDELPGISQNIKIFKWLPQSDVLHHPNVKLFITQGGLQSTDEAIIAGVPLIGIPMLMDQWYNVEKYVKHRIGIQLDITSLDENSFTEAIRISIEDKSYRENIKRLHFLMEDQPQSPLERAVWWTEYVLRHGGAKHLRAAGANITWADYLELELILFLAFSILVICVFIVLFALFTHRLLKLHYVKIKKP